MKKLLLTLSIATAACFTNAQTAVNFNVNDCNGTSHDLFTELNAGKVIVLGWVMPCSACAGPASSAHNIVQSYSVSNPGQVLFYLCDDFGTTSCATLNNWASANGLSVYTPFSNSAIKMSDYGSDGMPKTVVIGGANHAVYFNQNNSLTASTFSAAINNALAGTLNSISENNTVPFHAKVSPNPVHTELTLTVNHALTGGVSIEIYNALGQKVKTIENSPSFSDYQLKVNVDGLSNGNYFAKINTTKNSSTVKFLIAR